MFLIGLLRWGARLLAIAAAALFIAFLAGGDAPPLRSLSDAELLGLAAVFVMIAGTVVGIRWDLLGSVILLAGYLLVALLEKGWPPLPLAPFGIAGALLLAAALARRLLRRRRPSDAAPAPPSTA